MSLQALNSSVSLPQSPELKTSKPVQAQTNKEALVKVSSNLNQSDNLKTSGLSKNPVWEGVKLGAKDGLKTGAVVGPLAGVVTVALVAGVAGAFNGKGFSPMYFGASALLKGAAAGLVFGAVTGSLSGAADYGTKGVAVGIAAEKATKNGEDSSKSAKKAGQMLGATGGAVKGGFEGFKISKGMANPYAKVGVTAGFAVLGATTGYFAGGAIANKVYNASK